MAAPDMDCSYGGKHLRLPTSHRPAYATDGLEPDSATLRNWQDEANLKRRKEARYGART